MMKVKFLPQDIEVEIKPNESVLSVAQDHGIYIQSVCKGIPSCAECRVNIKEGESNVVPPLQPELELIGTSYFIDQRRLSCQLKCFGDVVVDLTTQIEKQKKSTKNPQGRYVKEREDSKARMGNILEEPGEKNDTSLDIDLEQERDNKKQDQQKAKTNNTGSRQQQHKNSKGPHKKSEDQKSKDNKTKRSKNQKRNRRNKNFKKNNNKKNNQNKNENK